MSGMIVITCVGWLEHHHLSRRTRVSIRYRNPLQVAVAYAVLVFAASPTLAEPGLLLIAHGAPSPRWNQPVIAFGEKVAKEIRGIGQFKAVRTAMLEAADPDVPTAVAELESAGCDRIVAVPLFVAPSGHTHFDVPAVLGIYASPRTNALLAAEGAKVAQVKIPITLTQTVSEGAMLERFAVDEVHRLSKSPAKEAVVVLAHGDPEHQLLLDRLMRRVVTACCGEAGIGYGDWAYIGVGQEYLSAGVGVVQAALEHRERVLVVGLYVSSSAARIHERSVAAMREREPDFDPYRGKEVILSEAAIIEHPAFQRWVLQTAQSALAQAGN
jgi:hypothetical protein